MKIWRYMAFDKFQYLIDDHALYFARADTFNAPLEGTFPKGSVTLFSVLKMKNLNEFLSKAASLRQSVAANCWHINDKESFDMWKKYTKNGHGVALRSTLSRLKKSISRHTDDWIRIIEMRYIDFSRAVIPPALGLPFEFKDVSYRNEKELRCLIYRNKAITEKGISIPVDIEALIGAIYISPFAENHFYDTVCTIIKKHVPVKRTFRSRFLNKG